MNARCPWSAPPEPGPHKATVCAAQARDEPRHYPPGQAPSWKSTDKDRYFLCGLVVKTGCSHHEIFGAQPLRILSMFRARIILGSFWARVHGRCGVPVVLHGPKSCWLKNYCDHNVHVSVKMLPKISSSIPLREPSSTYEKPLLLPV